MKKQLLFTLLYILFCYFSYAQTFLWAKADNKSGGSLIARSNNGCFYIANNNGVAKYDSTGNFVWQKAITGSITGFSVKGITTDSIGNLYVTGLFHGTVTLDSFTISSDPGNNNIYLAKFNSSGITQWISRSHNSAYFSNNASSDAITLDKQGNPILIGRFIDSLKLDSFVFDAPLTNQIFLAKYSSSGVCLWAKHLVSGSFDGGSNGPKIKSDQLGNTYISGHYIGDSAQFDNINIIPYHYGSSLGQDIFLAKIDSSGNFLWVKNIGGLGQEISGPMDVDSIGNTYLSGYFDSAPAYFDSYTLTTSNYSYFIAKYNPDGNCLWVTTGYTNSICAVNDGFYTNYPAFINKYDGLGDFQWTKNVPGASNNAMAANNSSVYITGSYIGTVNFDTCSLSNPTNQMFLAKLNDPTPPSIVTNVIEPLHSNGFSVYPNPARRVITISISTTNRKENITFKVNNSLGLTVYSETIKEISDSYTKQIDLSQLPIGIYFIELQQNGSLNHTKAFSKEVKKIILQ